MKRLPTKPSAKNELTTTVEVSKHLLGDIRALIDQTKTQVAQVVNSGLVELYWRIGRRIREDILKNQKAHYGEQIVYALSRKLATEHGPGFSQANLFHMIRFNEVYPDPQIFYALSRKLGWTHFRQIIYLEDSLERDFYAEMCRIEGWSTRTLQSKISGMLYERTGLSKKPHPIVRQELTALQQKDRMTPDLTFRDPYVLDFLGLKECFSERDLESAILHRLEEFLGEMGTDFTFVARQKRITVDHEDYYIDLLFYHRGLKALLVIELKLDKFKPADKGQMELYLRWLEKHDTRPGENPPMGLILCAAKGSEAVELLQLEKSGIRVAQYLTQLPARKVFQKRLHQAVKAARESIDRTEERNRDSAGESSHATHE